MILEMITVGPYGMNCYLIGDEATKEGAIVDPGAEVDRILSVVELHKLKVTKIINTHGHIDHIAGIEEVKVRLRVPLYLHPQDEFMLKQITPESVRRFRMKFFGVPTVDYYLNEGDEVPIGTLKAKVIHTPGHTPGGVCFLIGNVLIAGDTLFAGSVGRVDFAGGSAETLLDSIHKKLMILDPVTEVYPGHGPATTIGREKATNPFLQPGAIRHFR
ncbi:MAG: MBL fold metallo-hydrolase [Candidatus Tectomicrobia bacterium]|nr:MBL fold metallo-hydrolase [Candidatus Tectomicrobia bacterium]